MPNTDSNCSNPYLGTGREGRQQLVRNLHAQMDRTAEFSVYNT